MEADDMRMLHPLQHLQLVVDHLLVALDVLLEDDLDGELLAILFGLADDAVCACAQGLAQVIALSATSIRRRESPEGRHCEIETHTSCCSSQGALEGG